MADGSAPGTSGYDIEGVRPAVTGIYLTLRCGECATPFEAYQPTVLCAPVGALACPSCATRYAVEPGQLDAALERHLPYQHPDAMRRLTAEATRMAESWHRRPVLSSILHHRGILLGEAMERELLAVITLGLAQAEQASVQRGGDDTETQR